MPPWPFAVARARTPRGPSQDRRSPLARREVKLQDHLVLDDPTRGLEAVALVERLRRAIALAAAGQEDVGPGPVEQVGHHRVQGRRAVAASLVALVDEEPPQE